MIFKGFFYTNSFNKSNFKKGNLSTRVLTNSVNDKVAIPHDIAGLQVCTVRVG